MQFSLLFILHFSFSASSLPSFSQLSLLSSFLLNASDLTPFLFLRPLFSSFHHINYFILQISSFVLLFQIVSCLHRLNFFLGFLSSLMYLNFHITISLSFSTLFLPYFSLFPSLPFSHIHIIGLYITFSPSSSFRFSPFPYSSHPFSFSIYLLSFFVNSLSLSSPFLFISTS